MSAYIGGPYTTAEVHARLRREIDTRKAHHVQYWPVFSLQDHELAGCAGLRPYGSGGDVFELGVHLRTSYWGQGIALEAGRAVISYAFDHKAARSLFAGHHPANLAQQASSQTCYFLSRTKSFTRSQVKIHLPAYWSIPDTRVRCSVRNSNHNLGPLTRSACKTGVLRNRAGL